MANRDFKPCARERKRFRKHQFSLLSRWSDLRFGSAFQILLLLPLLLLGANAYGQAVANATVHGAVQDESGALVAGAQIAARQPDTGHVQTTVSSNDGTYSLPGLPVGAYTLEVNAPSFNKYVQTGIVLQVGQNVQINVTLRVGTLAEVVTVAADASMVETQETSTSEVIDQQRIVDIPLNGRQITDLVTLSGGASTPPNAGRVISSHDYANAAAVSVNGGQTNGNNYLLDGADHNDSHSNINLPFPFPDALQEFSVETSGVSARFGLHPGSVVNVVTKSGTNSIHGDVFEFVRNGVLNAKTFPAKTQDSLKRNQYGGMVGGPIVKNKIFLFGGFQETVTRTAPATTTSYVPTQQELQGDWTTEESATCQPSGAMTLINPATGKPFASTNHIDPSTYAAPSLALAKLIPVSSDPCGKMVYAIPNPTNEYQVISRLDWNQSARNTVMARYFILDYSNPPYYSNNILTTTRAGSLQRAQSIVLGDQFAVTPNLSNAFHLGYTRFAINRNDAATMPNMQSLGSNVNTAASNFADVQVSNFFTVGGSSNAPANYIRNQWQAAEDIDYIRGRNQYSFGGEYIDVQMDSTNLNYANGEFDFQAAAKSSLGQENALADFLLGNVNTFYDSNIMVSGLREKYVGMYAQDNFQVTRGLNIHLGVRWEPYLPEYDAGDRGNAFSQSNFNSGARTSLYTYAPPGLLFYGDKGIPRAYANSRYLDFAPRFGFAYDPKGDGKQSIRGSYGIFFDQPESYTNSVFATDAPWGNAITLTRPSGGIVNPFASYPGGNPYPIATPPSKTTTFPTAANYFFIPMDEHHPYMQQYNLSLERQFGNDWVLNADYLGNKATHLRGGREMNPAIYIPGASSSSNTQARRTLNQLNPTYGAYYAALSYMDDGINTNYNALRLSAKHRLSHSYSILAVYTFSRCMQDAETIPNKIATTESNPYNRNADRGPCDFDLHHNFVTSVIYEGHRFQDHTLNLIAGRWQTGFVVTANNGYPINPLTGSDASLSGINLDRPNAVANVSPYKKDNTAHTWMNPAAFVANGPGTFGTVASNSIVGPHFANLDANLQKQFSTFHDQNLMFRFEFFNLFNHTNYGLPVASLNSSAFGQIQTAANNGRIIQIAAKYTF